MEKVESWEWATTSGPAGITGSLGDFHPFDTIHPRQPLGIGWEICSTAASRGRMYWTWRRPKKLSRVVSRVGSRKETSRT